MSSESYPYNYVQHIQNGQILIANITSQIVSDLVKLGAVVSDNPNRGYRQAILTVDPDMKEELAALLETLRNLNLLFVYTPHGWSPASIFEELRDNGLVSGHIQVVSWRGKGQWMMFTR